MRKIIIGLAFVFVLALSACTTNNTGIPNPASKNCIDKGGELKMEEGPDGTVGICILPGGEECEEWSYYRGECPRDCSAGCPQYAQPSPDWCSSGKIISGGEDSCGCQLPPKCEDVICTDDAKLCPDGSYVARYGPDCEFAACKGEEKGKHICTEEEKVAEICTKEFMPVCGSDGNTYSNKCMACASKKIEYWTEGDCKTPEKIYCTEDQKKAEMCTLEYMPVCGDDGITYGNKCSACASKNIDYYILGECPGKQEGK